MNAPNRWLTFSIVSLALFMSMLDNLVVSTALATIQRALKASTADLEWTVNAYTLAFATLMLTGAGLGERFGRKRVFLIGVAMFSLGSALSALSQTAPELVLARGVQGIGAAFLTPLTLTILTSVFPPQKRAAALGLWSGVSGLGLAIGPLVGGAIVNGFPWSAVFWVNVPVGALIMVLGWLGLKESRGEPRPLDLSGLALGAAGAFGIAYGLIRGNALGWTEWSVLVSLSAGVFFVAAFVVRERMAAAPMLDLRLFQADGFAVANAAGFLMSAGMFGSIFFLTLFLQQVQGASPLEAGLKTMAWTGVIMLVAPGAGVIAGRIGSRSVVTVGMLAQAGALLLIGLLASPTTPYLELLPAFVLGGAGMGLTFAPLSALVMSIVAPTRQGQASGAYNAIRELGGVFGIAVLGAIFQHLASTRSLFMDGFRPAVFVGAGAVAFGAVLASHLPGIRRVVETAPVKEEAEGATVSVPLPVEAASPAPASAPILELLMPCRSCGHPIRDTVYGECGTWRPRATYCTRCGAHLETDVQPAVVPAQTPRAVVPAQSGPAPRMAELPLAQVVNSQLHEADPNATIVLSPPDRQKLTARVVAS